MLAIASTAISNGVPELGTDFLVASFEIIDDHSFLIWFTRAVANATTTSNYSVTGSSIRAVNLAQYVIEERDGVTLDLHKGVRIYLDSPLAVGQWTLSLVSGGAGTLLSEDSDALPLPTDTQVVFDLVDMSTNDTLGTGLVETPVSKFVPGRFRDKPVYAAVIAGLEAGDAIVREQARSAFDQYFVCTASGKFLEARAYDRGVSKPTNLGISDEDFRALTIAVSNNKLTNDAMLSILEILYGPDSVRGYVESYLAEPFELFDKAYLDLLVDGSQEFRYVVDWTDYQAPLRATAIELISSMNLAFDQNNIPAYATIELGKVRLYSKTKGLRSSIEITGGTLQPYLQFDAPVFEFIEEDEASTDRWRITNPRAGVVRFTGSAGIIVNSTATLVVGDYVTIIGSGFPSTLRGSYPVIAVYSAYVGGTRVEWFEIESEYVVPYVGPPPP